MKLKSIIIELSTDREFGDKFETTEDFWDKGAEILKVLKPIYIVTKEMQKVGYGLCDFYISWLRLQKNLDRFHAEETLLNLTYELERALEKRKSEVLDTPMMLAAIYLDPRVKFKLNATQKECAMLYLKQLNTRNQQLASNRDEVQAENETFLANNTLDELNEEFNSAQMYEIDDDPVSDTNLLMIAFAEYEKVKHVDFKNTVMNFWRIHKNDFPLIYPLACIVHAIPASQCLEERHFSSFSYIRNSKRCTLGAENVQNILTVRLNKELFYKEKQMDLENIVQNRNL